MHSQGTTPDASAQDMKFTTKHGFLVAMGWVAQKLGLREAFDRHLHIKQKAYQFKPNDKVIEALVGILGDCEYMKDLNSQAEPIASDVAVAKAWGQDGFTHSSTVCATFSKLTPENIGELTKALDEVQGPMLRKEVQALVGPNGQGQVVVGSSPRAWGTHQRSRGLLPEPRFIPTCVGNTHRPPRCRRA